MIVIVFIFIVVVLVVVGSERYSSRWHINPLHPFCGIKDMDPKPGSWISSVYFYKSHFWWWPDVYHMAVLPFVTGLCFGTGSFMGHHWLSVRVHYWLQQLWTRRLLGQ